MSIASSGIFAPDKNPAKTLYRHWHQLLKGWYGTNTLSRYSKIVYGNSNAGISVAGFDERDRPILAMWSGGEVTRIEVRADGTFRFGYVSAGFGSDSRYQLQKYTFLDFNYDFGSFHWYVNPSLFGFEPLERPGLPDGNRWYSPFGFLRDWRQPVPYIPERFLGARSYHAWGKPWMKCVPDEMFGWRMEPSMRHVETAARRREAQGAWDHFVQVRAKRYGATQRQYEIDAGLRPAPRPRGEPVEVTDDQAARFAAAFDLSEPACITPLRSTRPQEAQHGHDVVAQEQLQPTIVPSR